MTSPGRTTPAPDRRRRFELRILIPAIILAVIGLTLIETYLVDLGLDLPVANSILIFALININVLLIFLLIILVGRNLVKLILDRRARVLGSRLRTRMVVYFIALTLAPAGALFFVTVQFIGTTLGFWFDIQLDKPLQESLHVGQLYYRTSTQTAVSLARAAAERIEGERLLEPGRGERLKAFLEEKRNEYGLARLIIVDRGLSPLAEAVDPQNPGASSGEPPPAMIEEALAKAEPRSEITATGQGDFVSAVVPLNDPTGPPGQTVVGGLILTRVTPEGLIDKLEAIANGLKEYHQLKALGGPIKASHYITLTLAAVLLIFGALWLGFQLARGITGPLKELFEGTQRLAAGDYEVRVSAKTGDEIAMVIDSFNRMTRDLASSQGSLEEANRELRATNLEIERRRAYMEMVLENIAAGVVSLDEAGRVATINGSALQILGLVGHDLVGRSLVESLPLDQAEIFGGLLTALAESRTGRIESHLRLPQAKRTVALLVRAGQLRDESGRGLGSVVVMEDLTELEGAQRMAAWREVARRIAHEIKNPLTPIKLSAQRLMKRFGGEVRDREIFDQAAGTIVDQVDALKGLVDEFSQFARMPQANLALADPVEIINETLALYREAHKEIDFDLVIKTNPPRFNFDPDQIKRVLINLLDNAVAAIIDDTPAEDESGEPDRGRIMIRVNYVANLQLVRIEVADTGPGLPEGGRERLFEPHYSTKRQGTGLGLAIVRTIIQDHGGYIRVQDNAPKGTKFIIELPTGGWAGEWEVRENAPQHPGG